MVLPQFSQVMLKVVLLANANFCAPTAHRSREHYMPVQRC